jgi:hypothetical protein
MGDHAPGVFDPGLLHLRRLRRRSPTEGRVPASTEEVAGGWFVPPRAVFLRHDPSAGWFCRPPWRPGARAALCRAGQSAGGPAHSRGGAFAVRPVRGQQARLRCQRRRGYRPSPRPRRGRRPHSPGSKTRGDEPHRVAHPGGVPQPVSSASGLCDPFRGRMEWGIMLPGSSTPG